MYNGINLVSKYWKEIVQASEGNKSLAVPVAIELLKRRLTGVH